MASLLDGVLPEWDVSEVHIRHVDADPAAAWAALRSVTALDVRLLVPLMLVRSLPGLLLRRRAPMEDLRAPLLDGFLRSGFLVLAERPGEELVLGAVGRFWSLAGADALIRLSGPEEFAAFGRPGFARAATNFVVRADGAGAVVSTETRVLGTDEEATRHFRRYWRLVMPGSAAIRRSWLAAIARRAAL